MSLRTLPLLAGAILLAGCGGKDNYPSLGLRPAERLVTAPTPPTVVTSPAPERNVPAALARQLDSLVAAARVGYDRFTSARPAATSLADAGRGAPEGSENWARATGAISELEAARARTSQPLAEIDRIDVADRLAHAADDGVRDNGALRPTTLAITGARNTVAKWLEEEDATITTLDTALRH